MSGPTTLERINDFTPTAWSGTVYRHTASGPDPRSGTGARLFGGRGNPRGAFSTTYLAQPVATCMSELDRAADAAGTTTTALLTAGRELHEMRANEIRVLDVRDPTALGHAGLSTEDIADEDWTACQAVGEAAHFLDFQGVLAPSATGHGLVLAVFETRLQTAQLTVTNSRQLTAALYAT